jgi:hypothetical protein
VTAEGTYRLHEDWCDAGLDGCSAEQDCDCLLAHIKARIGRVTWANEEWDETYRQGYNKALSRVWSALGEAALPAWSKHENARRTVCSDCYFESSEGYDRVHAPDCPVVEKDGRPRPGEWQHWKWSCRSCGEVENSYLLQETAAEMAAGHTCRSASP